MISPGSRPTLRARVFCTLRLRTMQISIYDQIQDQKFLKYHKENPHVYQEFKKLTFKTIQKGFKHYSARGIIQLLRWHTGVSENGTGLKINDHRSMYYGRMFMNEYPEHDGFFRLRSSAADKFINKKPQHAI